MTNKKWDTLNAKTISNNIKKILDTGDITKMTNPTYKFIRDISGFIAHFDIQGFQHEYQNVEKLRNDLNKSRDLQRPNYYIEDSFFQKDEHSKDYYTSKSETLNAIKNIL
jgi:hypothetical protein